MLLLLASLTSGCTAAGFLAQAVGSGPVKASYAGLAGQSVGVMVWVDRGIRIDNPNLQIELAIVVQEKLKEAQKAGKDELKLTTFPVDPRSIARYQAEHPEIAAQPILEVAPNLTVSRIIYIEVTDFQTRPDAALELYRGVISASVRVIEVSPDGKARFGYEEGTVRTVFPKKCPVEGIPASSDVKIYNGTVDQFTSDVAIKFFTHDADEN